MQPYIPKTIAIFINKINGCKDLYNVLISKKLEPFKTISK